MSTIVKISSSEIPGMVNIMNKSSTINVNQRPSENISKWMNTQSVVYAKAKISATGNLEIKKLVAKSKW